MSVEASEQQHVYRVGTGHWIGSAAALGVAAWLFSWIIWRIAVEGELARLIGDTKAHPLLLGPLAAGGLGLGAASLATVWWALRSTVFLHRVEGRLDSIGDLSKWTHISALPVTLSGSVYAIQYDDALKRLILDSPIGVRVRMTIGPRGRVIQMERQ